MEELRAGRPLVLVIDDDRLVRAGIRRTLTNGGFSVIEAEDGDRALDAFEKNQPDAVTLDLNMPRTAGREVLQAIRLRCRQVPVVIVSGELEASTERSLLGAGASACIHKSDITAELVPKLRRVMQPVTSPAAATQATVLIVDDDERNVRLLAAILTASGYQTVLARSGTECLAKLEQTKPDLILLDVMMPGMDGLELCRLIKQAAATREIPVVMVTALTDRKDHQRAIEAGADDFLTKPVDKGELLLRLKSLLRIKRYADENRALRALGEDLAAMIVHDLSNPLGVMAVSLEFLLHTAEQRKLDPDSMESLLDAREACTRAQQLVSDILGLAELERSRMEPKRRAFDLVALVREVTRLQARCAVGSRVKLEVVTEDQLPRAYGDPSLTARALNNLIENAIRHSPEDGTVTISVEVSGSELQVAVKDRGEGIPPELHAVVFEKFRQLSDAVQTSRVGKLGLGLAFCKLAVTAQGGSIWVESSGGGDGATFKLELPRAEHEP